MSDKIPSEKPKSPQNLKQKEEIQSSGSSAQIERSAIPPSSTQQQLDVEKMTSSTKSALKRKREETEEVIEIYEPVEKKRALDHENKEQIADLLGKICEHLGPLPENLIDLKSIAEFCFDKIEERLLSPEYLTTEEIIKISQLLFDTELSSICAQVLLKPVNPIVPHPVSIFASLYNCLRALEAYPSFEEVVNAREKYLRENTIIVRYLEQDPSMRERILPMILKQISDFRDILDKCPIYTARDLFGGHNIHTVYILRDTEHNPKFIFKPTLEVNQELELIPLNVADPYELNIKEHVAHLLNFHTQFPIPAVFLVEIKGYIGSIQPFIGKTLKIDGSNSHQMSAKDLQAILIYDLLFSNCDRHLDNLLIIKEEEETHVYGIDHDSCMSFDNRPLKISYLEFAHAFNCPFVESVKNLVSEESIFRYKNTMQERKMSSQAIEWMEYAGQYLQEACESNKNADLIAKILIAEFGNRYVS